MFTVRTALILVAVAIVLVAFVEAGQGQVAQNTEIKAAANAAPSYAPQALATTLKPTKPPAYYIEQAHIYWNNMDTRFDQRVVPNYSPLVTRWEWPPWLLLAGTGRDVMIRSTSPFYGTANWVRDAKPAEPRAADEPPPAGSTIPKRECRFFPENPYARCVVVMEYARGPCPIYEEFTFNDDGEMTFIEAWTDHLDFRPNRDPKDVWAEGSDALRMSDRIPGLGNAKGLIDLNADWMHEAASGDPLVADFVESMRDPRASSLRQRELEGPDYWERGCLWDSSDKWTPSDTVAN